MATKILPPKRIAATRMPGWPNKAMARYPGLTLVASAKALQMLSAFTGQDYAGRTLAVKEGETLPLGTHTLRFLMAPMVHWPEVMVTFEEREKILFAADAFGKFGALSKCGWFGEEDGEKVVPLAPAVIAPLHGPILRENLGYYLDLYQTWSSYGVETEGVFIAYASIHGGTAEAAEKLAEILKAKGCPKVAMADLTRDDQAEAVEDAFRYGKMAVLAASYDGGLFSPAYNFLHTLQMKAYQQRRVALVENGSWAPSAGRVMKEMFAAMKAVEVAGPLVTIRSRMKAEDIPALEALADALLA